MAITLKVGDHGELVKRLQAALISYGYDLGPIGADGGFGNRTKVAVMDFQGKHGLPTTGVADPQTIAAMDLDPDTLKDLIEIDVQHDAGAGTRLVLVEELGGGRYRFAWNRDVQEEDVGPLLFEGEVPSGVEIAKEASGTFIISHITTDVAQRMRAEILQRVINAREGKMPLTEKPMPEGKAPAVDVEMDENAVLEWVHRMIEGAHWIAGPIEVIEIFHTPAGLTAVAGVTLAEVVGGIASTIIVLWEVVHAFGTGRRLQEQMGFCYGVMWETFRMPNGDKAFIPWFDDSAEDLREAFYDGVGQGRQKAQDIKIHNSVMIAVGYYMASKGSNEEWAQFYVLNDLWKQVRETDKGKGTLTWPKPEDMQPGF
jgi:Putative peptidoglycan binding domain